MWSYNIELTWWNKLFQKKSKQGGPTFLNPLDILVLYFYTWKFWIKHSITLGKIVLHNLEISRPKTRTPGNFAWIFLNAPGDLISFLIDPWNFHKLFLQYPLITASLSSFNFKFLVDIGKVLNFGRKTRHCVCYIFPSSDLVLIFCDYLSLIKSFRNSWSGNCK